MGAKLDAPDASTVRATFTDPFDAIMARHALEDQVRGVNIIIEPQVADERQVLSLSGRNTNFAELEFLGRIRGVKPEYASRSFMPPFESGASVESQAQLDHLRPLISENGDYRIGLSVRKPQA